MPSSTSSSDALPPAGRWGRVWLLALVLTAGALAGLERFWRSRGFVPSITADADLWCLQRDQVSDGRRSTIAVLGTSRINTGLNTQLLRRTCPGSRVGMLAVAGCYPDATLRDLAEDSQFTGLVLCETLPSSLLILRDEVLSVAHPDHQGRYVRYYHDVWALARAVERALRVRLEANFVLASSHLRLDLQGVPTLVRDCLRDRRRPSLPWGGVYRGRVILPDGSNLLDFRRFDARRSVAMLEENHRAILERYRPIPASEWRAYARQLGRLAERIRARGGQVVFLDYPLSDRQKDFIDRYFPREVFWRLLARESGAPVIRAEQVPRLARFSCPDGLHLDYRDALEFTSNLVTELRQQHLLPPGANGL